MNYNDKVYERLAAEYRGFIKSMNVLTGEMAMNYAYEKVSKEDILTCFECGGMNLSPKQAKALLAKYDALDYLYDVWMDTDHSHMDIVRESLDSGIERLTKEFREQSGYER